MKILRRVGKCSLLLVAVSIFSCSRNLPASSQNDQNNATSSESSLTIRASESPTDGDSREPELNATKDGRMILSWVEKLGRNVMRYVPQLETQTGGPKPGPLHKARIGSSTGPTSRQSLRCKTARWPHTGWSRADLELTPTM